MVEEGSPVETGAPKVGYAESEAEIILLNDKLSQRVGKRP